LAGLFGCLIFSESRIAYVAFAGSVGFYLVLRLDLLRGDNKLLAAAAACLLIATITIVISLTLSAILQSLQFFLVDWRPGSWLVRLRIYQETLRLLPEHWLVGWGAPIRIPGAPNNYSAGTHSSLLGMLFQHGIVGLFIYLSIWVTIWRAVVYGLRGRRESRALALFWPAVAAALFGFNLREIADNWWWDQLTTYVLWLTWGLVLSGTRIMVPGPDNRPPVAADGSRSESSGPCGA
jgi:O-antigen ligase